MTAAGAADGGLLAFGTSTDEPGDQANDDAAVTKLGGDERPTPTETAMPTDTPAPTDTPESGSEETTTSEDGLGFGMGATLAALGVGALLRRSNLIDDETGD